MTKIKSKDLNQCEVHDLIDAEISGLSEAKAMRLVEYRDENGDFTSWEDVQSVPGFNQTIIDDMRAAGITLEGERVGNRHTENTPDVGTGYAGDDS